MGLAILFGLLLGWAASSYVIWRLSPLRTATVVVGGGFLACMAAIAVIASIINPKEGWLVLVIVGALSVWALLQKHKQKGARTAGAGMPTDRKNDPLGIGHWPRWKQLALFMVLMIAFFVMDSAFGRLWAWLFMLAAGFVAVIVRQKHESIRTESSSLPSTVARPTVDGPSALGPEVHVSSDNRLIVAIPEESPGADIRDGQYDVLVHMMNLDQWDAARSKLQQIAYGMGTATPQEKVAFTAVMKEFAARDPLLAGVLRVVMPLVRAQPGILQTEIYACVPGVGPEQARYALYFAEQLGILRREKKGRSYKLFAADVSG